MTRVGLVLGAGGVVGQAYHAGVLAALENDLGWDPRTADVVVGTSAGSITGTLLRSGVPAHDLAAWTVKAPLSAEGEVLEQLFGTEHATFEPFRPGDLLRRPPSLPGPAMVRRVVTKPWHFRPMAAGLALLAPGTIDIAEHLSSMREMEPDRWPEGLWICVVRRRDGRRVIFGRPGSPPATLHRAVAASCSVPGYFTPVRIGKLTYVDGGAHSPTNAAILRDQGLDLVVVVAPMAGPHGPVARDLYEALNAHSTRVLRREVRALRAAGTQVVVFRPGELEHEAMGDDFMSSENVERVVQEAFFAAGARAASRPVAQLLAPLRR